MLYKEWLGVRFKLAIWFMVYLMTFVLILVQKSPADYVWGSPLFSVWLGVTTVLTPILAVLGGADLVSEEVDKGTLSFLLTRPVSRFQIYSTKIALNLAGLLTAYGSVSLLIMLIDRFQTRPSKFWESLALCGLVMLAGTCIVCLGGVASVFTRNVLQTISLTIFVPIVLAGIIGLTLWFLINVVFKEVYLPEVLDPQYLWLISRTASVIVVATAIIGLVGLTGGLFLAGLYSFSRKEF